MIELNEKARTVKMTRHEMNKIRLALTSVMFSFEEGSEDRRMWWKIKEKLVAQLDEQDKNDPDYPT